MNKEKKNRMEMFFAFFAGTSCKKAVINVFTRKGYLTLINILSVIAVSVILTGCGNESSVATPQTGTSETSTTQSNDVHLLAINPAASVYVSAASGNDVNQGTKALPLKTIQAGIQKASALGYKDVLVQAGAYNEVVSIIPGININGGYGAKWTYSTMNTVTITGGLDASSGQYITLVTKNAATPTTIADVTVIGPTPPAATGLSSYAVYAFNANGLTLQNSAIFSGTGASGADGLNETNASLTPAPSGAAGGPAASVFLCNSTLAGAGGAGGVNGTASAATGGAGGAGGSADTACFTGLRFNLAAQPGHAGSNAASFLLPSGIGGAGGAVCTAGGAGADGYTVNGTAGFTTMATERIAGNFFDPGSGIGGTGGSATGGGGGGGSGGCDSSGNAYGAGGGGGGAGGLGGAGGSGGQGGGSSFGIFAVSSTMTVTNSHITLGTGGAGGRGGAGGTGQPGGAGGAGGAGLGAGRALNGGSGGKGGNGGSGGGGGGGLGGNAVGILEVNSSVGTTSVTYTGGTAGLGGAGGVSPGNSGASGPNGSFINMRICTGTTLPYLTCH